MDDATIQVATDLFLANEKLVWWTIRRFFGENPPERQDEMYGEGRLWLWRAALTYDPAKGATFSTYGVLVVRRGLLRWLRLYHGELQVEQQSVSLQTVLATEGDGEVTLEDSIQDPVCLEDHAEIRELLQAARGSQVAKLKAEGFTQQQIAKKLGRDQNSVRLEIERFVGPESPRRGPTLKNRGFALVENIRLLTAALRPEALLA